ncbi:hypothetical protein GCM10009780_42510 [Actinomadura alba]
MQRIERFRGNAGFLLEDPPIDVRAQQAMRIWDNVASGEQAEVTSDVVHRLMDGVDADVLTAAEARHRSVVRR